MDWFGVATQRWFRETFEAPTPVQHKGWAAIARGEHSLLIAPTGSGKTLAAFLYAIDRLIRTPRDTPGVRVLYVSPLKALVYDVERNLRSPLIGIDRAARGTGERHTPRVDIRTGDTSAQDRRRQAKHPAEILVTTPESLYLILGSQARETLRTVECVIVDEVHALAPIKRGVHLGLSLERLSTLADQDPQRIGLSATARPLDEVARFLGGDRTVSIIDTSVAPRLDCQIVVPVRDMTRPEVPEPEDGAREDDAGRDREPELRDADDGDVDSEIARDIEDEMDGSPADLDADFERPVPPAGTLMHATHDEAVQQHSIWPAVHPRLLELIRAHRTTIVFVNSRGLCERLSQRLNDLAEEPLVRAHHGSLAHEQRREIEEALKTGGLRCIVATSSLELGIDMGTVDLVVMVESPGAVSRGLQRIGRAGHGVGEISIGRIFPKHRGDLLEATVVARRMNSGEIEALSVPRNTLDVLAQQIVAMVAVQEWSVPDLRALIRRTASFRDLPDDGLSGVLDMLAGRYPSHDFADLRPRIVWDRDTDRLSARRGSKMLAAVNGGTIPDRGLYGVYLGHDGPRIGELDEEMVHETTSGQTFMLGASTWRVEEITRDRVIVAPAPGEPGKLPFWHGEGPGRPVELGRAIGAFVRDIGSKTHPKAVEELIGGYRLDQWAAENLVDYLLEQREETGTLPTDRAITIERFRDELGDWRVCILTPFGARVHAPWALTVQARLSARAGFDVQAMWSDDGIVLTVADGDEPPDLELLIPDPVEIDDQLVEQLGRSAVFAAQFRENASRALLLPRRRPGSRTPLFAQRLRAQKLLAVAQGFPAFPIVIETYRACLKDVFDVPSLKDILQGIQQRAIRVDEVETKTASPFARSLVFAYVAAYLYEGDSPLAERRAQALSLDRKLLRELLGQEELRELLDAAVIDDLEAELQGLTDERRVDHPDGLHDLLRRLGDLTEDEIALRSQEASEAWLDELRRSRRAVPMKIAGRPSWVAIEDVAYYRDALGAVPPPGLPEVFLEEKERPLDALLLRYARTHGPFEAAAVGARFGFSTTQARALLEALFRDGRILAGDF
ncbi:MAG: DEAD/DEAH box helicase, partial [Myxococcota bacterium]